MVQLSSVYHRVTGSPVTGALALAAAIGLLLATGVAGVGRKDHREETDLLYFYTAGMCWKEGLSPYDAKFLTEKSRGTTNVGEAGIAYPPQSSALFLMLALLPLRVADMAWMAAGFASIALIAWLCAGPLRRPPSASAPDSAPEMRWIIAAIVLGLPFASHDLWKGGSALVASVFLVAAWACAQRDRWALGGILLGIATFKPQLALVPVIWLLLERRGKILAVGFVTAMVLSLPAFLASGLFHAYAEWFSALKYAASRAQLDGTWSEMGLRRFLMTAGMTLPDLVLLAPVAAVALWKFRARIALQDQYPLLLGISFQFIYLHDGDLTAIAPMVPAYFRHLRGKAVGWIALALLALICFPQRLLRSTHLGPAAFIRIPALAALVVWLLWLTLRESRPEPARVGGLEQA